MLGLPAVLGAHTKTPRRHYIAHNSTRHPTRMGLFCRQGWAHTLAGRPGAAPWPLELAHKPIFCSGLPSPRPLPSHDAAAASGCQLSAGSALCEFGQGSPPSGTASDCALLSRSKHRTYRGGMFARPCRSHTAGYGASSQMQIRRTFRTLRGIVAHGRPGHPSFPPQSTGVSGLMTSSPVECPSRPSASF